MSSKLLRRAFASLVLIGLFSIVGCDPSDPEPPFKEPPSKEPPLAHESYHKEPPPKQLAGETPTVTSESEPVTVNPNLTAEPTPLRQPASDDTQVEYVASVTPESSEPGSNVTEPVSDDLEQRYAGIPLTVVRISEASYDGGSTVHIQFSVPLDERQSFAEYISVNSRKGKSWILSDDRRNLYMLDAEPQTQYRLTVNAGLKGINDSVLNSASRATVTTQAAPASLEFASDGRVLAFSSQQGLPVITQNVAEANVSFFRLHDDKLNQISRYLGHGTRASQWNLNNLAKLAELKYEGRFKLTDEQNHRRQINLPVRDIPELATPGVYLVVMQAPGTFENQLATTYYSLTDIGLHLHQYANQAELLVQSLETTLPIAAATVELLGQDGSSIKLGNTNRDGQLSIRRTLLNRNNTGATLVVRKGTSVSLLSLNTSALDLSDFHFSQRPAHQQELFIYSPRDLYRGGETAEFSALLRGPDGEKIRLPKLKAVFTRPDGQQVKTLSLAAEDAGYYHWSLPLAADAMTGNWNVSIKLPDNSTSRYQFKVEDFMPERLKISWHPQATRSDANQHTGAGNLIVPLLGEYLYGAPAAGNRLQAALDIKPELRPFEHWPDYVFGNAGATDWNSQSQLEHTLDTQGKLDLNIANSWSASPTPMAVTITASLFESGGRPVVRRQKEIWLPEQQLVGVKALFDDRAPANGMAHFELLMTDGSDQLFAASQVTVRLINTNPDYDWRYNSNRGWYYEKQDRATVELSLTVDLSASQPTRIAVPVDWGHYRLEVQNPHNGQTAVLTFESGYAWYGQYAQNRQGNARPRQVTLAWDKGGYEGGDVARLSITPPSAAEQSLAQPNSQSHSQASAQPTPQPTSQALVMVEADTLLWLKRIDLSSQGGQVDIPIDPGWKRHDLYVTVLYLQPADSQKRITPTRAVGLIHLPLDRRDRQLTIESNAPAKWLPDRTVNVDLQVTDNQQQPVQKAWVTLAAVDVGVLSISRFDTPDPFRFFFEPRRYAVDLFDLYSQVIDFNNSQPATLNFGGDAAMARGGDMARSQVHIVSLFSGKVAVVNGVARIPLQLPDFNGRLRLMAVAFTDHAFGHLEQEVTVAAPVVTQLSMPRFAGMNDDAQIALDVTNLSGKSLTLTVTADASGAVEFQTEPHTLTLANQQKQTLVYPFKATYPEAASLGDIEFRMQVTGLQEYPIDRRWTLVSRPTLPAYTEFARGRLSSNEQLQLSAEQLTGLDARYISTQLTMDEQVNLNPHRQLDQLLHYPYGCLEQSVSSSYPWLIVGQQQIDVFNNGTSRSAHPISREQAMEAGIQRIIKKVRSSGGFSLWSSDDPYEQHWLTAYTTQFLIDAKTHGFAVDQQIIDKALTRLHDYIRGRAENAERWNDDASLYRFVYRAYAAYVLAQQQRITLTDVRKLSNAKPANATPLALVQLALAARQLGDNALANQLMQQAQHAKRPSHMYIGDYGSPIRDQAAIAALLMANGMEPAWADDLLLALETELRRRRYLSTQERIQLLNASQQQAQQQQQPSPNTPAWQANLSYADVSHDLSGTHMKRFHYDDPTVLQGLSLTNTGAESVSAELAVQGYRELASQQSSGNVAIERHYYSRTGEPIALTDQPLRLATGDLILVELRIASTQYRPDLMAVDLLPAGLELENQNLLDSQSVADILVDSTSVADWTRNNGVLHQEYRDDRFVAALETGAHRSSRVFYLARAVTPGKYRIPGPLLEDMYDPEARSVGANAHWLIIE